jgi:hypothetical protein
MTSFDFLESLFSTIPQESQNITFLGFILIIIASIVFSIACGYLYLIFFDKNSTGSKVYRAFPLIGPAITCIFLTVQFSLPLSLGLLGALSIVRFRTPIKEPEEIGFILLLIACSLSIATFNLSLTFILFVLAYLTLHLLKRFNLLQSSHNKTSLLHVEIPIGDQQELDTVDRIKEHLAKSNIQVDIASIHHDTHHAHVTYKTLNYTDASASIIKDMKSEFPNVIIDYHHA